MHQDRWPCCSRECGAAHLEVTVLQHLHIRQLRKDRHMFWQDLDIPDIQTPAIRHQMV